MGEHARGACVSTERIESPPSLSAQRFPELRRELLKCRCIPPFNESISSEDGSGAAQCRARVPRPEDVVRSCRDAPVDKVFAHDDHVQIGGGKRPESSVSGWVGEAEQMRGRSSVAEAMEDRGAGSGERETREAGSGSGVLNF